MTAKDFTGTVNALIPKRHEGFPTFAHAVVVIKDGRVVSVDVGQPLYAFEALARVETANVNLYEALKKSYPPEPPKKKA